MKIKILLTSLVILLLSTKPIIANSGLTVSPSTIELMMAPNKKVIQNIAIKNQGQTTSYSFTLYRLLPIGENGENTINQEKLDLSSIPYVITINGTKIDNFTLPIEAQAENNITLQIESATTDTSSSDSLILAIEPSDKNSLSSHTIIGIPLLLTLTSTGILDINFDLLGFSLPIIYDSQSPLQLNLQLKNNSPFIHRLGGNLEISSQDQKITHNVKSQIILGGTTRNISFEQVSGNIIEPSFSRIGPHTFTINVITPGGKTIITQAKTVWFFPIRLFLTLTALVSTLLIIFLRQKNKNRPLTPPHN